MSTNGIGSDDHTLDDPERIGFQNHPVHKSPGISFIAIHNDKFRIIFCLLRYLPFLSGGKSCSSSPPQPTGFDLIDDIIRRELRKTAFQGFKTTFGTIFLKVDGIDLTRMLGGNMFLSTQKSLNTRITHMKRMTREHARMWIIDDFLNKTEGRIFDPLA